MKTTLFHEYKLSQFMLGTVQFGFPYGIANRTGQPSYQTVLKIMEHAAANGVNCLDTAPAYGDSEKTIGRAMRELGIADQMVVVTKVPAMDDNLKLAEADKLVRQGVETSLKNLQLDKLQICLFHKESNAIYADSLQKMKQKGLVKHIGISANSPEWALKAVRSGQFEAMQLPTSILDQRYLKNGTFHEAKQNGMALFVRSVYLQGLLFLPEPEVPPPLSAVIEVRRRLEQLAAKAKISLAELAARFVMSLEGVYCLVLGLETIEQLQDNVKLFAQGPLSPELLQDVFQAVPQLPDKVLVPWFWPLEAFARQLRAWDLAMPAVKPLVLDFGLGDFYRIGLIEYWIANEVEAGYCGKFLFVFDQQICPRHHHREKHETFFVVKGDVEMDYDGKVRRMKPGDVLQVECGKPHEFRGVGPALILEISKPCFIADNYFADSRIPIGGNYKDRVK